MAQLNNWRINSESGWCRLTLDVPRASQNVLSAEVIAELDIALEQIERDAPNAVLLCSGKERGFVAGADVREFAKIESGEQAAEALASAHRVFARLEALPMPSVALINGHCLGGGLELALACDFRVAADSESARIGLPEVLLGIHPGFGGSVRLIETIGAPAALQLMLSGRGLAPRSARRLGVVDYAVPMRQLESAARYAVSRPRLPDGKLKGLWKTVMASLPARALMCAFIKRQLRARVRREHYPAPYQLLELWRRHGNDREAMFAAERESVAQLITSAASRNLVKLFFLREKLKKVPKETGKENAHFSHIHVIGAGVMGGDIAAWCVLRGLRATLHDSNPAALANAMKRAHNLFRRRLKSPRLVQRALDRFQPDPAGDGARRADVILEAIVEDRAAKAAVFAEVQKVARSGALLATNTSGIPLEELASGLRAPGQLVGLHFFNPVARMQLIEVVRGEQSSPDSLAAAAAFAARIGRLPLAVKSRPGFLVNRILMPYLLEAVQLLEEGVRGEIVDRAAEQFGMAMGPVELADNVGLDVCMHVARNLTKTYGGEAPGMLAQKVEGGNLGKKTGEGFYRWTRGKAQKEKADSDARTLAAIEERLIFRMLNESVACLNEGIVDGADSLDAGMVFGAGFAPFRGGPVAYIIEQGQEAALRRFDGLQERYGERFAPCAGWKELQLGE
ncbi:MAG: 3-hydroxyacyl-CoA dehydrogenase NAD-binding domain-containing protein [Gammaproteobacteria bacterium]|nr:3-hydroxyacyl-CoA dehydrogenase NAD-binding domain-containing protein [Gammaproteobacteria bacterium]